MMMSDSEFLQEMQNLIRSVCDFVEKKISSRLSKLPFDPDNRATYEVIAGLVSRQATLCCEFGKNPNAWTCHLAPIILRSMADVYITFAWILLEPDKRAQDYIKHALGLVKLEIEYRKGEQEQKFNEANEVIIKDKEAWLNSQRWDFLTEVNVGSWSGKSTRKMAEEAQCDEFYRLVYEPFSACSHSTWQHIEPYNLEWCDNALHIPHRVPKTRFDQQDPFHFTLAAKYLDKMLGKFDEMIFFKEDSPTVQSFLRCSLDNLNEKLNDKNPSEE